MEYGSNSRFNNFVEKDIQQYEQQKNLNQISSTLNKLYHSINPNCPNNYQLPYNFQKLLQRILSSNFSVMKKDESIIISSLLEKVYKSSQYNKETINKFQYLYSKLTRKKNLTKRWGILYILNSLSKNNLKNLNFLATNKLQQNYLKEENYKLPKNNCIENILLNNYNSISNIPDNSININQLENNNFNINDNKGCNPNCSKKCKNYLNNLSPISNINEKFCDNEHLIICNDKMNNNTINNNSYYSPIIVNPKKTSLTITENDIINDLLFVFEGINGKYIAYDASKDAFILNKLMPWNEEIYNIVNSLSELGWLYKKIKLFIDFYKNFTIKSQFIQSFIYSVQNELDEYYKLISFFRKININNSREGSQIGKKTLNLKNLLLWTLKPKEKLKWISYCCESIHSLKGVSILSQIYSFVNYGGCNEYLNNLLNDVSKPFINFIVNWIKYGELQDPYKEFFVQILSGIGEDDIWNLKYQIIGKNVPNFMKRRPTIKIFEVGKCIHFIRTYCKENYNLSHLKNILAILIEKSKKINRNIANANNIMEQEEEENLDIKSNNIIKNFDYGFDDDKILYEIEALHSCYEFINYLFNPSNQKEIYDISFINSIINNIDIIHKLINKDLVRILLQKFNFMSNLESINKYLLLGQGDMMQTLIESLFEELDKPANLIFKHNLQSHLESAIRASNAQFKDAENIKKLNIKLINPSPGDSGWEIFCLEYKVDSPLNIIFSSKLLKDYQKLFIFFWKIKRIKFTQINHILIKLKNINTNSNNKDAIEKAIRISIHFNQEIVHFISNLHNYFALEVLETQYKKLKNELLKINNLDELILKHKQFVRNIKSQCLLDEESVTINKKIFAIFNIILKFSTSFDIFCSILDEIKYEYLDNKLGNDNIYSPNRNKNINQYLKQASALYNEFHNQMIELINIIELVGKNNLKYLSMKLDFNYFYSFIEKEKEDKRNLMAIKKINDEKLKKRIINEEEDYNNISLNNDDNDINNLENYNNENQNDNIIGHKYNDKDNEFNDNINDENDNNNINNINDSYKEIEEDGFENEEEELKNDESNNFNKNDNQKNKNIKELKYDNNFNKRNDIFDNDDMYNNIMNANKNNKNKIDNLDNNIDNKPYIKKQIENNILDNINNKNLNNAAKWNNYNISNDLTNNNLRKTNLNINNNDSFKTLNDPKTYHYEKNSLPEKGLTFNYKNNGEIETNVADIEDEDQIITSVKPKIYGVTTRSKGKNGNNIK